MFFIPLKRMKGELVTYRYRKLTDNSMLTLQTTALLVFNNDDNLPINLFMYCQDFR